MAKNSLGKKNENENRSGNGSGNESGNENGNENASRNGDGSGKENENTSGNKNGTKGFVAILFCFCCPLLMSLLLFFFSTSLLLKLRAQSQHLCRVHGLKAQEAILKNLKKLFSLNPKALKLEIQNKKLKAKRVFYLATGNAVKVAHIQALLLKVYLKKEDWPVNKSYFCSKQEGMQALFCFS